MAEAFGTAASVVGVTSAAINLLGGCIRGFILLSTAQNLGKDGSTIVCMLNIQEIQLTDWARRAGLLTGDGSLDRRLNGQAVEETLRQLELLLTDAETLKKRYGLILAPSAVANGRTTALAQSTVIAASKVKLVFTAVSDDTRRRILTSAGIAQERNLIRRLWWAAVDKEKMEKLVVDIHFLVRELWHLLDPWRHDDLENSVNDIANGMLALNNKFDQLKSLNEALSSLKNVSDPNSGTGLAAIATSAELKALRIGLEDDGRVVLGDQQSTAPKRQLFVAKLERLSKQKLTGFAPLRKRDDVGLAKYDGKAVFIERKATNPMLRSKILPRAEDLATLLSVPKDQTFSSLRCRGIVQQDDGMDFVYEVKARQGTALPRSLLDLFSAKDGLEPPSLSLRLHLALQITKIVRNFHRTGWLHKSLRPDNVLFFTSDDASAETVLAEPVLIGFSFSRFGAPTEISEQPSADPRHDIYRHPYALGEPTESFNAAMDIYSLGTILLEIAEWRALRYLVDTVVDVGAPAVALDRLASVRPFLLSGQGKGGTSKVRMRMGDIYASVCRMCLAGEVDPTLLEEGISTRGVRAGILDTAVRQLEGCKI